MARPPKYVDVMTRKMTIRLPDDLITWLTNEARRKGLNLSEIGRDILEQYRNDQR